MKVYLDNGATTRVDPRVLKEMLPYFTTKFGNASSLHQFGQEAKEGLEKARKQIANSIGAKPSEIIFTSGGTESDNLAIHGVYKGHIITSTIEHPAILNVCKHLNHSIIPVNEYGFINLEKFEKAINSQSMATVMFANNEIGTIEPIKRLTEICTSKGILFHTDAVQAFGKIPIDVKKLNIDLMTLSSHKIYGPKGVGALYVKEGTSVKPMLRGGGHEKNIRSGTENIPGIVGFGKATELAVKDMKKDNVKLIKMRDKIIKNLLEVPNSMLNGHPRDRLSNNVNISFDFIEGEALILHLDTRGISASTGSACSSKKLEPSHVLTAIGLRPEQAHGSLRMTLGRFNTMNEIDYTLKIVPQIVEKLRKISPFR
ncbi:MAG: aminotransferase class V-fold PLP-dependent enzyme [Nanoarchaeota archaeon]|nr:aminotransferase class V-fold PLP-dependent enzyme [Nanoarchaeota archaeon]